MNDNMKKTYSEVMEIIIAELRNTKFKDGGKSNIVGQINNTVSVKAKELFPEALYTNTSFKYMTDNDKNRCFQIMFKGDKYGISFYYELACKVVSDGWKREYNVKSITYNLEDNTNKDKTIEQILSDNLELDKSKSNSRKEKLQKDIEEAQEKFSKLIEQMKNGEELNWNDKYDVEKLLKDYQDAKREGLV